MATWLLPIAGCFDEGPGVDSSPQSSSSGDTTADGTGTTGTGTTTTSDTASGSGSDSVDSGSVDSSSDTAGMPVCGDGAVAGDELCDDGNDTPGDGCSGCVPSGTVVWSYSAGTDVDDEGAEALLLRPADLVVVGGIATTGNDRDVWVQVLDRDGGAVARVTADGEGQDDRAFALASAADGGFMVTGGLGRTPSGELWLGRFDPDATLVEESEQGSTEEFDLGLGVAPLPGGGAAVAGQSAGLDADKDGWLMVFDGVDYVDEVRCDCGFLGTARRVTSTPAGALASVWFEEFSWHLRGYQGAIDSMSLPVWDQSLDNVIGEVALAQAPDGNLHVCGATPGFNDIELWWGVFTPQGDPQLDASFDLGDGDQECQALEVQGGRVVLAGTIDVGAGQKTSVVTAVDVADATPVYQAEIAIDDAGWTRVRGIAVDGDAVYVAGALGPTELETDAFAARLVH